MNTLILYDSYFGNTEKVALAIRKTLGEDNVLLIKASDWSPACLEGVSLFIVGSPTRAFRPTPAITGILKSLPSDCLKGISTATFDTRACLEEVNSRLLKTAVKFFGYAAEPIADRLVKKGGIQALPPEGFEVTGEQGPLKEGELERAALWAGSLKQA